MPAGTVSLAGMLRGEAGIRGKTSDMRIDGELTFAGTNVGVPMIGTSFGLSETPIVIRDNEVLFTNFAIVSPNKKPLTIDGRISLGDFSQITTDLRMKARDFEMIDVRKNRRSMVYGTGYLDLDATVKGPLDELTVRGDASLLNGTEITYVMRDSPLEVQNKKQDLVTFVSFRDTTAVQAADSVAPIRIGGIDMLVNVSVNSSAKLAVDLSDDGQNRIDLQGGGDLTYTMNRLGDTRFSGKYVVSGGTVRYSPPVISELVFKITQGSSVEWTGNMEDPMLNITAVETMRTNVSTEGQSSRPVNFNISIRIRNTLENLSITFDLSAPEDLAMQNELSSLTAEQRATQAMNLLIYNTYTGPGTTAKTNSSNPLNNFIEKELNQWAANSLKGVDLSFGIDSYDDEATGGRGNRTDYSYQLSKSLFNNRLKAVIGGKISSDADPDENLKENLIDDVSLEYRLTKRDNMFLKLFRHTGYESILEGEVTQTGLGFVIRKKLLKLSDLFRIMRNRVQAPDSVETENPATNDARPPAMSYARRTRPETKRQESKNPYRFRRQTNLKQMKRYRLHIAFLTAAALVAGCSTTKRLGQDEVLYTGVRKITIEADSGVHMPSYVESAVKNPLSVKPNNPLYSPYIRTPLPVGLWAYNYLHTEKTKGFKHWLYERLAKDPVLVSSVQPELRVQMVSDILANYGYFGSRAEYETRYKKHGRKARLSYRVYAAPPWRYSRIAYPAVRDR